MLAVLATAPTACGQNAPTKAASPMTCTTPADRDMIENALGHYPEDVSPLSTAVLCDDRAGVDAALAGRADPNLREPGGLTPVLIAAALSREEILRKLLAAGGDPDAYESDTGQLALAYALAAGVHHQDWRAYDTLLDKADINAGGGKVTPIGDWAVTLGQFDRVAELLDRGYRKDLSGLAWTLERRSAGDAGEARDKALAKVRALIATEARP
jgi:hypothetical protein